MMYAVRIQTFRPIFLYFDSNRLRGLCRVPSESARRPIIESSFEQQYRSSTHLNMTCVQGQLRILSGDEIKGRFSGKMGNQHLLNTNVENIAKRIQNDTNCALKTFTNMLKFIKSNINLNVMYPKDIACSKYIRDSIKHVFWLYLLCSYLIDANYPLFH